MENVNNYLMVIFGMLCVDIDFALAILFHFFFLINFCGFNIFHHYKFHSRADFLGKIRFPT